MRVLEVQEHANRSVFPDESAWLHEDALVWAQVADEGIALRVQEEEPGTALRGKPIHHLAERVMPLLLVAVLGGVPDPRWLPVIGHVRCCHQEPVLCHVDSVIGRQRYRQRLTRMVGADGDIAGTASG